jgi:HEAT repeat protein
MKAAALVLGLVVVAASEPVGAAKPEAKDPIQSLLDAGALKGAYNPVLLDYLTEEGRDKLPDKQKQSALDQLVTGFREQVQIKPGAQAVAGLATALGAVLGGTAGQGISEGAAQVWTEWVDGAFVLQKAGYKTEAAAFFENCVRTFPYDTLRGRCAVGLAQGEPEKAFTIVLSLLGSEYPEEVQQAALRTLGAMAAGEGLPQPQKDRAVEELVKRTKGLSAAGLGEAAIDGLAHSRDPRAVEPLKKMTKGMFATHKYAAKRALLLAFNDAEALQALQKDTKGGFAKEPRDQVLAALALVEAGQQSGFDFAVEYLSKKKKPDPDFSAEIVSALLAKGGDQARDALARAFPAQKPGTWLAASMAIGLLQLGDDSHLDVVRAALDNKDWLHTRLEAAAVLAARKDYSGLPVLRALTENPGLLKSAADLALGTYRDPEAVRIAVAGTLGRIDHADAVPILVGLMADKSPEVRLAAAYALAGMTDPAALDGLAKAVEADYGKDEGRSRNPELHAHVLRAAAARFPKDPRTAALLGKGSQSAFVSVKFLALAAAR